MKRVIFCLLMLLCLVGCSDAVNTQYYLMDTVMSFEIHGENAKTAEREIADTIADLEKTFSPTREDSELYAVNHTSLPMQSSDSFLELLRMSLSYAEETKGAFDPTLGGVSALWKRGEVPTEKEIAAQVSGVQHVSIAENTVNRGGVTLDFGAVAKGYASDCAKKILDTYNVERALLSLGGNLYVRGTKRDGTPYLIGVRDPNGAAEEWLGLLEVSDVFVVASGDYERYFEQDGVRYHHILDPATRAPAKSDLRETVIVCDSGTRADVLSTALFVMGSETAVDYWKQHRDFEMVLVKNDAVLVTPNLAKTFDLTNSAYRLEVIE